ncbi:MAG: hypothetical protein SFT91_04320 [Rickettsiaceae bacterium]|nr:hypothetical protein [Rickettsiaceae bacterium]
MPSQQKEITHYYSNDKLNRGYSASEKDSGNDAQADETGKSSHGYMDGGFLPPVHVMKEYEAAFPGSFAKIVAMAEKEQANRIAIEKISSEIDYRTKRLGGIFGILTLIFICFTTICISVDFWLSVIFVISSFTAIFGISLISFFKKPKNHFHGYNNNRSSYLKGEHRGDKRRNKQRFRK